MSWIKVIPFDEATGKLKQIYNKIKGTKNQIDNVMSIHSLRPHTLTGHMSLYKNTLHHSDNTFPNWFLEFLGTYTSFINRCDYCYKHHFEGMKRFLKDNEKAGLLKFHIENDSLENILDKKELALSKYTKDLTLNADEITKAQIENLRRFGIDDGELLEVNQLVSYFNYVNITFIGLGVNTDKEILCLSPNNKNDDRAWSHQ
jgi:uncharacterized peroxidase-related enzyme